MEAWIIAVTLGPLAFLGLVLGAFALLRRGRQPAPTTEPQTTATTPDQTIPQTPTTPPTSLDPCDPANMPTGGSVLDMSEEDLNWLRRVAGGSAGSDGLQVNITVAELAAELCRSDRERDKVRAQMERVSAVKSSVQRVIHQDQETAGQQQQVGTLAGETNSLVEQMRRRGPTAVTTAPTAQATPVTEEALPPMNGEENGEDVPPPHTPVDLR